MQTVKDKEHTKLFFEELRKQVTTGKLDMQQISDRTGRPQYELQQAIYGSLRMDDVMRNDIETEIKLALDSTMQQYLIDTIQVVETAQYNTALSALNSALDTPQFILVIGAPGYGKSFAFKKFKRMHADDVQFFTVLATDTKKSLMKRIAEDVGARNIGYNNLASSILFPRIMARIGVKRTMLVFDEGDRLNYSDLEWMRDLTDENEEFKKPRTSAVIFGNFNLLETARSGNVNMSETRTMRSQLNRRVKVITMPELSALDVTKFVGDRFPGVEIEPERAQDIADLLTYDGGYGVIDEARRALAKRVTDGKLKESALGAQHIQDMIAKLTNPKD